jgi:serine carboxypeptidase 1
LVGVLHGFFEKRPEFKKVPLHIFSQSYGGKMASEFAYELYNDIKDGKIECNLTSVALGNSWIDPVRSTLSWAPFLEQTGHIDQDGYDAIMKYARLSERYLAEGQGSLSTDMWLQTEYEVMRYGFNVDFYNILSRISYRGNFQARETVSKEFLRKLGYDLMVLHRSRNLLDQSKEADALSLNQILNGPVKEALGLPKHVYWGSQGGAVFDTLAGDFMKPVVHVVEKLLNETDVQVVVYTGQVDLICSTPATIDWINAMQWSGSEKYRKSYRSAIGVNGVIEGFHRGYGNFNVYWISRAGHMPPADNPDGMRHVLKKVTKFDQN